jgi:hypothetical protein
MAMKKPPTPQSSRRTGSNRPERIPRSLLYGILDRIRCRTNPERHSLNPLLFDKELKGAGLHILRELRLSCYHQSLMTTGQELGKPEKDHMCGTSHVFSAPDGPERPVRECAERFWAFIVERIVHADPFGEFALLIAVPSRVCGVVVASNLAPSAFAVWNIGSTLTLCSWKPART